MAPLRTTSTRTCGSRFLTRIRHCHRTSSDVANNGGPAARRNTRTISSRRKSEQFIADHADDDDPFYMEVAYTIPHYDIDAIASAPDGYGDYAVAMPWTISKRRTPR